MKANGNGYGLCQRPGTSKLPKNLFDLIGNEF